MKARHAALSLDADRRAALRDAEMLLQEARARAPGERMHRSLRHLPLRPRSFFLTLAVAALATLLLWVERPVVMAAWERMVLWWARGLGIPLQLVDDGTVHRWSYTAGADALVPGASTWVATALVVIAALASTWWMADRFTPLKYLVRTICVVQVTALLFFMAVPSLFPYTAEAHLAAMLDGGYTLMVSLPVLVGLGYGLLDLPAWRKLVDPLMLLAYFAVALPHKAVLHMVVLQHFSVLFMPLLYLCFGLVFDIMLFVALYSFLVSRAPVRAVG